MVTFILLGIAALMHGQTVFNLDCAPQQATVNSVMRRAYSRFKWLTVGEFPGDGNFAHLVDLGAQAALKLISRLPTDR